MKYFFAVLLIGGLLCLINFWIFNFLKSRLKNNQDNFEPESDIGSLKEDLDKDIGELQSLIDSSLKEAREERSRIEEEKGTLKELIAESKSYIERLEKLSQEIAQKLPEFECSLQKECEPSGKAWRDKNYSMIHSLLKQGLSIEDIAQSLNMGIAELRLRLAVLKKEDFYNES